MLWCSGSRSHVRSRSRLFLLLLALATAVGMPHPVTGQEPPRTGQDAPDSARQVPDSIRRAVERFATAFQEAVRAYDVDAWADLVTEEVVMMVADARMTEGRDAFRELWERTFEGRTGPNPLSVAVQEVLESGDLVAVRADYGPEGRDPVGQYVWVLERGKDGDLLLRWWMFSRRGAGE